MDSQGWELSTNPSRTDRRHSSSASSVTVSTEDVQMSSSGRGRRTRPSVTSASSQLATVRERQGQRTLSWETNAKGSGNFPPPRSDEEVVSSKKVLREFRKVASRGDSQREVKRLQKLQQYKEQDEGPRKIYEQLRHRADEMARREKSMLPPWAFLSLPPLPSVEELVNLARHYYPPRGELLVHVCDFGDDRAEHMTVPLGEIEEYWQAKPPWVDVRWIHAPLGLGLAHSSIEDIFLHDGPNGREFEHAGRSGWPFLETEVLNFRGREDFQEMREVYLFLKDKKNLPGDLQGFQESLEKHIWDNEKNASLQHDMTWRADHLGVKLDYWNLVSSDMPWQLTEGIAMTNLVPLEGLKPVGRHIDQQAVSSHPFYKDAQLVRSPFRCFHRSDGYLLTLSPMAGVNYLDKNMASYLKEPIDGMFENDNASAIGHIYQAFAEKGTRTWHKRSLEWFLIYLITEVGVTPHNFRQGHNAPSLEAAYQSVIQDLKRRRYDPWQRNETVKLVREYLGCVDELTTVKLILQKKVDLFQQLLLDTKKFETDDDRNSVGVHCKEGESSPDRVKWALSMVKAQLECYERLLTDLKQSMNALFQLRSIEQNELAIVSESQNKAILVFTAVTIIFLPLSFFTSYYGMNLKGIVDTAYSQSDFWRVCGSIAFAIVLCVALGAFRHRIRRLLHPVRLRQASMV